jgi:hypothetical protein
MEAIYSILYLIVTRVAVPHQLCERMRDASTALDIHRSGRVELAVEVSLRTQRLGTVHAALPSLPCSDTPRAQSQAPAAE